MPIENQGDFIRGDAGVEFLLGVGRLVGFEAAVAENHLDPGRQRIVSIGQRFKADMGDAAALSQDHGGVVSASTPRAHVPFRFPA